MTESEKIPGWRISEEALRSIASEISAGRTLVPESWPNQSRVAVLFSFDVDTQTWELMKGGRPSLSELSRGEYGARVGLGRVVDLLADFEIPASFFVPAVSAMLYPTIVETIQSNQDHEIGVHGWIHEHPSWLEADEETVLDGAIAQRPHRTMWHGRHSSRGLSRSGVRSPRAHVRNPAETRFPLRRLAHGRRSTLRNPRER